MRIYIRGEGDDVAFGEPGGSTATATPVLAQRRTKAEKAEAARRWRVEIRTLLTSGVNGLTKALERWREKMEIHTTPGRNGKPRNLMMMTMIAEALGYPSGQVHVLLHDNGLLVTRAVAGSTVEDGRVLLTART